MITSFLASVLSCHFPLALFREFSPVFILPLAGIALGAIAVIGSFILADRNRKRRHETIRFALEKGQPVPVALMEEDDSMQRAKNSPRDDRRSGLILIAVGAGIYVFFLMLGIHQVQWIGAIPGFIGVALLLNALIDGFKRPTPPRAD